jgi:hypothetical protein
MQGVPNSLADCLLNIYEHSHSETWQWFEKALSYSNASCRRLSSWPAGAAKTKE